MVDWELFTTITGSDTTNFGITTAAIDLQDSTFDRLNPGTIQSSGGQAFSGYAFPSGGSYNSGAMKLENIGPLQFSQSASTIGVDSSHGGSPVLYRPQV